ncbi:hypothetical protein N836_26035 [Leptolyngbya sp. Heron Island J]|uniref:BREX-6 system phosphatase PglZ n=1 Tax=Leptolyngbya sp. Heron Island J TaxID=1385935 RepID=UPI0003B9434A|nr:BREX-6 system phosphatase PglZ [Leptolyngbya sp. Heron Island J]ESA32469.1 hypothetical protein N836_26035 [Leptolyngbya sp. Heron Island J]
MSSLGPITTTLEADVSRELRQQHLVIWLDKDSHYTDYVDELAQRYSQGDFFAPVIPFRGSYLEMMLALENHGNKETPDLLLIHMPGHTTKSVRRTPILEMYRAGTRYQKALDTLVRNAATGKVNPDDIDGYLSHGISSLEEAEQWLTTALSKPQDDLSHYLENLSLDWILDSLVGTDKTLKTKFSDPKSLPLLEEHLYRYTGLDKDFIQFYLNHPVDKFDDLGDTLAAWLMCVEYVHDLKREPKLEQLQPLKQLSKPLRENCETLVNHLRHDHSDTYVGLANRVETLLAQEFDNIQPEDLGKIDTFKEEENTVFSKGALTALENSNWQQALYWTHSRLKADSFWLPRDPQRRLEWSLIQTMAHLGTTMDRVGQPLDPGQTLPEALDAYAGDSQDSQGDSRGHRVDNAHRKMEQELSEKLDSKLPHFNKLRDCADQLRQHYRAWANGWAESFAQICEHQSFLPDSSLQQRTLYEDVVHPLLESGAKVAYFLVDALRYEMAAELRNTLQGSGTQVILKARYGELPTLTSVGMNAVVPTAKGGKLTLAKGDFKGFKTGEFTVKDPDTRVRAMCDRSLSNSRKAELITLAKMSDPSTKGLKKLGKATLVIVHSTEIDDSGEANVGVVTFERWLQQLKSAWNQLRNLGFDEFVFTADHGFLLREPNPNNEHSWGNNRRVPKRRHLLSPDRRNEDWLTTVSLKSLGYEGQEGYLHFARDIDPFSTGTTAAANFIHGGNSLQERVIPVLTVSHRSNNKPLKLRNYQIEARAKKSPPGLSRIQVRVKPVATAQGVLGFTGAKIINLTLQVPKRPDIDVILSETSDVPINNQQAAITIEEDWADIWFDLKGPQDERVRIQVYQSDGAENVDPTLVDTYFDVAGSKLKQESNQETKQETKPSPTNDDDWQSSFEDETIRQVFIHIDTHGAITETELINMLGNARKSRRFARNFDTYQAKVPFEMRVEASGSGKRYVKGARE